MSLKKYWKGIYE